MTASAYPIGNTETHLRQLASWARAGDSEAFGALYQSCHRRVLGLCRRLLLRQEDAEDAAADVFLKLRQNLDRYDPSLPFLPWLLTVTAHQSLDLLRRRNSYARHVASDESFLRVSEEPGPSPLAHFLSGEQRQQLRRQVERLPDHYRVPLVLHYYAEMKYRDIARTLGVPTNMVKTLIFRAKKELRRKMMSMPTRRPVRAETGSELLPHAEVGSAVEQRLAG